MRKFVVCLEINTNEGNPGKWDWPDLIDEECSLISVKEVK